MTGRSTTVVVDRQVRHLLRLMGRVGLLDGHRAAGEREEDDPGRRAVAREVAAEGTVLLVNDGLLPLTGPVSRVAVIGPNASQLAMGGGSSEVTPYRRRSVTDALAERLPDAVVTSEVGCRIDRGLPAIDLRLLDGEAFGVEYFDQAEPSGAPLATEVAHSARVLWIGPPQPGLVVGRCSVRIGGTFTPDVSGRWRLGLESAGRSVLRVDGAVVVDNTEPVRGEGFYGAGSQPVEAACDLEAGRPYELSVEVWPRSASSPILGARIGAARPEAGDEFERAVAAARAADLAVVVVGSNGQWESEGHDRPDLSLPGRQRELVEAVIAANPRTVVVVNAGSPVEMPWAERAAAVLMTWYPGEEGADALADILVGASEPGGRLPITFPARVEDGPTGGDTRRYPGENGEVFYEEGVFVGYRHHETAGVAPLFAFGHGLSYGEIAYDEVTVTPERVRVRLHQRGGAARHRGGAGVRAGARAPRAAARPRAGGVREGPGGGRPAGDGRGGARRCGLPGTGTWTRMDGARTRVATRCWSGPRPGTSGRVPSSWAASRRHDVTGDDPGPSRPWTLTWDRLLVEPRRPRVIREQPNAPWFAVAAVCVGAFMGQLDASIVTVALPTLQRTFDASVGAVTWVGLSYLLVLVATVTAVGRFADMWGHKLLYVYGFLIFTLASALCGLAPSLGRAVRLPGPPGRRAAMLQANSLAIIVLVVPGRALGQGHRAPGRGPGAGARHGPLDRRAAARGGRLATHLLRQHPLRAPGRCWPRSCWCPGAATSWPACGSTGAGWRSSSRRWWRCSRRSPSGPRWDGARVLIVGLFVVAGVLGVLFIRHERRDKDPMLDLGLFRNAQFSTGIASGIGSYLVMFGVLLLVPFYLERGQGLGTARSGLELMAMPLAFGVVAPFAGRLADRLGARPLTVVGMGLVAGGLAILGAVRPPTGAFLALLAVVGVGMGLFTSPNNASIMGAAPEQQAGMASGVLNMTRGFGTALGLALTGTVFVVAGGDTGSTAGAQHAFTVTSYVLAAIATGAGVISALRSNGPLADTVLSSVE